MSSVNVLTALELLSLIASIMKNKAGDTAVITDVADVIEMGVAAAKAGSAAKENLMELRGQLDQFNMEGRGPSDDEKNEWRERSGRASDRIQTAAKAGEPVGDPEPKPLSDDVSFFDKKTDQDE